MCAFCIEGESKQKTATQRDRPLLIKNYNFSLPQVITFEKLDYILKSPVV